MVMRGAAGVGEWECSGGVTVCTVEGCDWARLASVPTHGINNPRVLIHGKTDRSMIPTLLQHQFFRPDGVGNPDEHDLRSSIDNSWQSG